MSVICYKKTFGKPTRVQGTASFAVDKSAIMFYVCSNPSGAAGGTLFDIVNKKQRLAPNRSGAR